MKSACKLYPIHAGEEVLGYLSPCFSRTSYSLFCKTASLREVMRGIFYSSFRHSTQVSSIFLRGINEIYPKFFHLILKIIQLSSDRIRLSRFAPLKREDYRDIILRKQFLKDHAIESTNIARTRTWNLWDFKDLAGHPDQKDLWGHLVNNTLKQWYSFIWRSTWPNGIDWSIGISGRWRRSWTSRNWRFLTFLIIRL